MRKSFILLLLTLLSNGTIAQFKLRGIVVDKETGSPLPFVSIVYNEKGQGLTTSLDGRFELETVQPVGSLKFSFIGYGIHNETINQNSYKKDLIIGLSPQSYNLEEVIIKPGINPAHRIVKEVIKNRESNNPEKLPQFKYNSYNKMYFTFLKDSIDNSHDDLLDKDSVTSSSTDSILAKLENFKKRQHIFLMESITERSYISPNNNSERVIASRVSGLKDPFFVFLATQFQSFSFYPELINLGGKNYLNPISKGSTNRYLFILEDTILTQTYDSIFVISFRPLLNKNFDGLKGVMNINSNGYAIQNVIAEPVEQPSPLFSMKVQQRYELIDSTQWFPIELNTDLNLTMANMQAQDSVTGQRIPISMIGVGRSYIKNIELNPKLKPREFSHVELTFDPLSGQRDDLFWSKFRNDSLSQQDIKTYQVIDSIGKEINLDKRIRLMESLITGKVPIGYFDLDLSAIINYNRFEGYRLGIGAETNQKLLSWFTVGGYYAYGFKDQENKYGGFGKLILSKRHQVSIEGRYQHDVREPGELRYQKPFGLINSDLFRDVLVWKMDYVDSYSGRINFRILKNLSVGLVGNQMQFNSQSGYEVNSPNISSSNNFTTNEIGTELKFVWKETFMETPRGLLPLGFNYPLIWFKYFNGIPDYGGKFSYNRFEMRIDYQLQYRTIGKTNITLTGGIINGDIPTPLLGFAPGANGKYPLDATSSFATMYLYEFVSDKYGYIFLRHSFGTLLKNSKPKFFKPQLTLVHNMAIGDYRKQTMHIFPEGSPSTLSKGYLESGILINGILSNPFYGIGVGAYYRWGYNSLSTWQENVAIKLTLTTNF